MKLKLSLLLMAGLVQAAPLSAQNKYKLEAEPPYSKYTLYSPDVITTKGWLHEFLEYQKSGLTGHIENAGYPFNTGMWTAEIDNGISDRYWWPYEQSGYFVDGCLKAGYLLHDSMLIHKAKQQVDHVLNQHNANGRLGPQDLKGRWNKWPYTGFLRSFMTEYSVKHDPRIVAAMLKHYSTYKGEEFADELDLANAEEMCWLYGVAGDKKMLQMAEAAYATFKSDHKYHDRDGRDINFSSDMKPNYHGVVYLELVKIPAILYSYTGNASYLNEAQHGISQMETYDMLVSGVPSSSEHFEGISETAGHETCNLSTIPYTYGYMLQITGEARWADKIERAVFNAGIGAITKDFRSEQYFSAPNQFIATMTSNHLGYHRARMAFLPGHDTECCTGNVNRFMPYYIDLMWLNPKDNGIAAALYGPGEISIKAGKEKRPVRIIETTQYPFEEKVEFTISTKTPVKFPFKLRIPGWCDSPAIMVNGRKVTTSIQKGEFFTIDRVFKDGDKVELSLPMHVTLSKWPHDGIAVERGPIVYSYPIPAFVDTVQHYDKSSAAFPGTAYTPTGAWNYGLLAKTGSDIEVFKNSHYTYPWNAASAPVTLRVPVEQLTNWALHPAKDEKGEPTLQTSAFPDQRDSTGEKTYIDLVPYGSTFLRLTVFPRIDR
ncbi:MAG TPA: beta-L-arabinofuranosidase domain-containing protein [Puia sp.]|nr:beta-L-arabinofuranosidase domain-containing protein [Puia sp.]